MKQTFEIVIDKQWLTSWNASSEQMYDFLATLPDTMLSKVSKEGKIIDIGALPVDEQSHFLQRLANFQRIEL